MFMVEILVIIIIKLLVLVLIDVVMFLILILGNIIYNEDIICDVVRNFKEFMDKEFYNIK